MKSKNYLLILSLFLTVSYPVAAMEKEDKVSVNAHKLPTKIDSILDLPDEILLHVLSFFSPKDLSSLVFVSKKLRDFSKDPSLGTPVLFTSTRKGVIVTQENGKTRASVSEDKIVSIILKSARPVALKPNNELCLKYWIGSQEGNPTTVTFSWRSNEPKPQLLGNQLSLSNKTSTSGLQEWIYSQNSPKEFNLWVKCTYANPLTPQVPVTVMKSLLVKIKEKDQ